MLAEIASKALRADQLYCHELLTAAAALLEEIAASKLGDDGATVLAASYRKQAAEFEACMKMPPVKFVRGS